jgi:hypothetical protein
LEDLIAKGRGKLEYPQVQVTTFAVFFWLFWIITIFFKVWCTYIVRNKKEKSFR